MLSLLAPFNKKYFITYLFLLIIFLFPILHITIKDNDFSLIENRYLEKFPKFTLDNFLSGNFSEKLNNYLEDHFPFRNQFVSLNSYFEIIMGRNDINEVYLAKNNYLIDMFNKIDLNITDRNITLINKFSKNMNVSLMLIPTSTEVLKDYLPKFSVNINQEEYLNYVETNLNKNINFINPLYILKSKKNEYIYYRTDHHYTTLGAYYSYLKFCESYNITPLEINDFKITQISNDFLGSLFSKVNLNHQKKDSVYIFEPLTKNDLTVYYGDRVTNSLYEFSHLQNNRSHYNIFLDNNHPLIKIKTSIKNGKNIVVIKDSYANSFIPFLTKNFEEIHVIDLRFYNSNINAYLNENNLKDILFFYNVKNFSEENNLIFINKLEED